ATHKSQPCIVTHHFNNKNVDLISTRVGPKSVSHFFTSIWTHGFRTHVLVTLATRLGVNLGAMDQPHPQRNHPRRSYYRIAAGLKLRPAGSVLHAPPLGGSSGTTSYP